MISLWIIFDSDKKVKQFPLISKRFPGILVLGRAMFKTAMSLVVLPSPILWVRRFDFFKRKAEMTQATPLRHTFFLTFSAFDESTDVIASTSCFLPVCFFTPRKCASHTRWLNHRKVFFCSLHLDAWQCWKHFFAKRFSWRKFSK